MATETDTMYVQNVDDYLCGLSKHENDKQYPWLLTKFLKFNRQELVYKREDMGRKFGELRK